MEKKYVVSDEAKAVARDAVRLRMRGCDELADAAVEAFVQYQAEHPPQLDDEQWFAISGGRTFATRDLQAVLNAAIYRAYLAPEPEIPREVEGLFAGRPTIDKKTHDRSVVEAYELGLRAGRQG